MEILEHSLIDTLPMIPILIVTFVLIEYMEHKFGNELQQKVKKAGKFGPIIGALVGVLPQCGFSIMAVALFSREIITFGTMISIFIATSDEAIPVLLSMPEAYDKILPLIVAKVGFAILIGYILDLTVGKLFLGKVSIKDSKEMEKEAAPCIEKRGINFKKIFLHSLERTLKISIYLFLVTAIITFVVHDFGITTISENAAKGSFAEIFLMALIGLVPNCAISVGIVKLFSMNIISFASVVAGLSSNAGLALIFLFKESKSKKRALFITLILFLSSLLCGVILKLLGVSC